MPMEILAWERHKDVAVINLLLGSRPPPLQWQQRAWDELSSWIYLKTHTSLSPIWRGFVPGFVIYKKGCTRLTATCDKVYQLLVHGRWFSLGTPASSTTKTGRYDMAEILLKVALKHQKSNQINQWQYRHKQAKSAQIRSHTLSQK